MHMMNGHQNGLILPDPKTDFQRLLIMGRIIFCSDEKLRTWTPWKETYPPSLNWSMGEKPTQGYCLTIYPLPISITKHFVPCNVPPLSPIPCQTSPLVTTTAPTLYHFTTLITDLNTMLPYQKTLTSLVSVTKAYLILCRHDMWPLTKQSQLHP